MNNNWVYFGVFLDKNSVSLILNKIGKYIPNDWKIYCHHMTIAFNNKTDKVEQLYQSYKERFGEKVNITITGIGMSNDALAVKVNFQGQTMNNIPHITIATPLNGKPVNSNFITNWKTFKQPFIVTGILNVFSQKRFN